MIFCIGETTALGETVLAFLTFRNLCRCKLYFMQLNIITISKPKRLFRIEETGESFGLTHVNISFQDSISSFSLLEQFFNETSWNVTNEFYEDPTEKYQPHKCWFENEPLSFYVMESLKFVIGFIIPFAIISKFVFLFFAYS